ncbi:MAG: hypothetical protein LBV67_12335 [Streptococcaceae bacterium]|jgi:hypothetical protein|nr:hypothetical protein [Streptococcaceae bacterium]
MPREVLLIEPNYKNKYPPMGLMKISTYYKQRGDNVRFYKGDLQKFMATLLCEELIRLLSGISPKMKWRQLIPTLTKYIRNGKISDMPEEIVRNNEGTVADAEIIIDLILEYRNKFKRKDFFTNPRFDVVCITTLFTFEWSITVDTINYVKQLCKNEQKVFVGGIASSIIPQEIARETGVVPIEGALDRPGMLDFGSSVIIDTLPLDYSILDEIDYKYPASNAYFAYMTRGCPKKCKFCAVPKLEPKYNNYIQLYEQLEITRGRFGEKKNLLLLDNNVLASDAYDQIIDEIVNCGFGKSAKYTPPNPYEIAYKNLVDGINDRAYIRVIVDLYHTLLSRCSNPNICSDIAVTNKLYKKIIDAECDETYTATKEAILNLHQFIGPLYMKYAYRPVAQQRIVDFNQGIDGQRVTPEKMNKLAEANIHPVRIAFDSWKGHRIYEAAVRTAAAAGLTDLSNYVLFNYNEEPVDLYRRMRLSVDLCEELNVTIFSFPMKYHPVDDPKWFRNRNFIGEKWSRKYIRAVQAVLTSTHGKIGRGRQFFEAAFGADEVEFNEIMMMPEALIINRFEHDREKRERFGRVDDYADACDDITGEWRDVFNKLNDSQKMVAYPIILNNKFSDNDIAVGDPIVYHLLRFYQIVRLRH